MINHGLKEKDLHLLDAKLVDISLSAKAGIYKIPKDGIEKTISLIDAINIFVQFIIAELISNGKIKIGLLDIPKLWRAAKALIESILTIFPGKDILRRLEAQPLGIGDVIVDYMVWCFQYVVTADNKIKIPILKIIPFIIRTIKLVKDLTEMFKRKGLMP